MVIIKRLKKRCFKINEGMSKYQNGKIYKITDVGYNKCYIGSTCESLSQRLARHRYNYKNGREWNNLTHCSKLFDEYGVENCKIELIENYLCQNREELLKREGHHIKSNECLNRCVAGRTITEWKEDNKEHYKQMRKAYSENSKEYICQKAREYYNENKDAINEKRKEKVDCICGASVRQYDIRRHERTKKHKDFINNQ